MDFLPSVSCVPSAASSAPGVVVLVVFAWVDRGPLAAMYEVQVIMRYELQSRSQRMHMVPSTGNTYAQMVNSHPIHIKTTEATASPFFP